MMAEQGTYVYAISRDLDPAVLQHVTGVGDAPVRMIESSGLTAIVSTVDFDEFGERALHQNLENLAWLEQTARSHHGVAEAASESAAVTPLRLATVYYGDQRVRDLLAEQHDVFSAALDRITDRVEWGIKAYAQLPDDKQANRGYTAQGPDTSEAEGPAESGPSGTSGAGAAYLRRRREQRQSREQASRQAYDKADQLHAELRTFSAASRLHRAQDSGLSGRSGLMVLNGAYLVDRERDEQFIDMIRRLASAQQDLHIEVTGPWAPYSFATVAEDEQREGHHEQAEPSEPEES